jgi:soluble lytic murein transglycosylase-like protein
VILTDVHKAAFAIAHTLLSGEFASASIDILDVMAFCEQESTFDPKAYRFEPRLGEASYGLMQILASTARDRGFVGQEAELYEIPINVRLGIAQLAWIRDYLKRHGVDTGGSLLTAGAYNGGVGNICHGFLPGTYVAQWWRKRVAVAEAFRPLVSVSSSSPPLVSGG